MYRCYWFRIRERMITSTPSLLSLSLDSLSLLIPVTILSNHHWLMISPSSNRNQSSTVHSRAHLGWLRAFDFQIQFSKQNVFGKKGVEMIFKLFLKYYYTQFQNQQKRFCEFDFQFNKKHTFPTFDNDTFCYHHPYHRHHHHHCHHQILPSSLPPPRPPHYQHRYHLHRCCYHHHQHQHYHHHQHCYHQPHWCHHVIVTIVATDIASITTINFTTMSLSSPPLPTIPPLSPPPPQNMPLTFSF